MSNDFDHLFLICYFVLSQDKMSSESILSKVDKNSSGDEIANVNFFYNIAHVEASAYAH